MRISVGTDPEVFVTDGDKILPAHLFTTGTKEHPEEIEPGFNVHYDNISLEFNVPPSESIEEFQENIKRGLDICEDVIGWDNDILIQSAVRLTEEQIKGMGDPVMMFRCDPEVNIWGEPGYPNQDPLVRSAGGHIHIGWGMNVPLSQQEIVAQWADALIGLPLCLMDDESAPMRRTMYGKPGAIRFKPYGIEYRTPSNQWLLSPERQATVFNCVIRTMEMASKYGAFPYYDHLPTIKEAIMNSNKFHATDLNNYFNEVL